MHPSRLFAWIPAAALLVACGGSEAPHAVATYTAEQLNTLAAPPPPEEVPGAPANPGAASADTTPPPSPAAVGTARVRVIHAAPDPAVARVSVYLDSQPAAAIEPAVYRRDSGYRDVPAGEHTVSLRQTTDAPDAAPALTAHTPALAADHAYTVVVHGLASGEPALALSAAEDDSTEPEAGHARVRFFHALAGVGPVDVCLAGAHPTAVFANVAYGAWGAATPTSGYATAPGGHPVTLQVRAQNAAPCTGRVLGTVTHPLGDRRVYTTVAIGRVLAHPDANAHAEPRQLLVCPEVPPAVGEGCTPVAIR